MFSKAQFNVFQGDDYRRLEIDSYIYGEGMATLKLDLHNAQITTDLNAGLKDLKYPSFWRLKCGRHQVKFTFKKKRQDHLVEARLIILTFGFYPLFWRTVTARPSVFSGLFDIQAKQ